MNILIYRLGSLGDTVVALPCFHQIAASFPDAKRFLLTNIPVSVKAAPAELILAGSSLIDEVLTYKIGIRGPSAIHALRQTLRSKKFDAAIYLTEPRTRLSLLRDYIFLKSCAIKTILGTPFQHDDFRHRVDSSGVFEYEAERLARSIRALGPIDLNNRANWDLRLTASEISKASSLLSPVAGKPILAINTGGKLLEKDWGDRNWLAALSGIDATQPNLAMVCVGSADESPRANNLIRSLDRPVLNLCGELTPRETAAVFDQCDLFLGHDSGPMHLAASRNTRCIAIFGSANHSKIWHPYGPDHIVFHNQADVKLVSPAAIVEAVSQTFNARRKTRTVE